MKHPLLSSSLALLLAHGASTALAQDNVLIVIADDLGVDAVSTYGEGQNPAPTPTLDTIAANGVLFRNGWAYSQCSPTRAAINTGRYGYRTGVGQPGGGSQLSLNEWTLPEVLDERNSGHAHAWIGKWHLGGNNANHPNLSGWGHFAGTLANIGDYEDWTRVVNGTSQAMTSYATTQVVDDALRWIEDQESPWTCVVAFQAPHAPFHEPPAHLHTQDLTGLSPQEESGALYRAMVEAVDTELDRLFHSLGASVMDETYVLFLGDNGTPNAVAEAPFVAGKVKGSPYEGGVGVPFLVSGPGVVDPGREVNGRVHAVDLFATALELAGVGGPLPLVRQDSVSLVPHLVASGGGPVRPIAYSERFQGDPDSNGWAVARNNNFKLIRRYDNQGVMSEEFYQLGADPFEDVNLLPNLTPQQQNRYEQLAAHIDEVRDESALLELLSPATCVQTYGTPSMAATGSPTLGGSYSVQLSDGPLGSLVLLGTGFSDAVWGEQSLPWDLSALGWNAGCQLSTSLHSLEFVPADPLGTAEREIVLPDAPLLLGGSLYHSWLVLDLFPSGGDFPWAVSNGLRVRFGE